LEKFFLQFREFVGQVDYARQTVGWVFNGSVVHDVFPGRPVIDDF
jgi:hypothetical protein